MTAHQNTAAQTAAQVKQAMEGGNPEAAAWAIATFIRLRRTDKTYNRGVSCRNAAVGRLCGYSLQVRGRDWWLVPHHQRTSEHPDCLATVTWEAVMG